MPPWCGSRTGTCSARWSRRTRGAASASRIARWASPSETPSHGCTGTTAWRAAPSPSQVRARRAAPGVRGPSGSAQPCVSPAVKYLNAYTGTVLLRCRKDSYRLLCSALPFVRHLESRAQRYPCCLNTLHVGGTIRTCQKFLIQYNRTQLLKLLQNCTNEEERQCIQKSLLSCSLTEEQAQSGDEEEDDGTETD
ncbi:ribonuclease P/MRP protein subunit POP5 isoform X2 [Sylvia atricapilla]|uniref:ribonuclease P/MRP protein subunit POP5 isoform X2 n=1 Tax=Sylvia atricapilla TaxID=48155 RepID=UPI00339612DB